MVRCACGCPCERHHNYCSQCGRDLRRPRRPGGFLTGRWKVVGLLAFGLLGMRGLGLAGTAEMLAKENLADVVDYLYEQEILRQETVHLAEAEQADNGPKEISIFCPQEPQVHVVDLPRNEVEDGICL